MIDNSNFVLYEERPENVKALKVIHTECIEMLSLLGARFIVRLENCDKSYDVTDICQVQPCVGDYIVKDRNSSFGYEFMRKPSFEKKYKLQSVNN